MHRCRMATRGRRRGRISYHESSPLRRLTPLLLLCLAALALAPRAVAGETAIAGWTERVRLLPSELELAAKLDSGAENSSLHIERQRFFRKGGKRWVRFTVEGESGRRVAFERRVMRYAAIKSHSGRSDRRPVVEMKICLGGVTKKIEVNLVDRSRLEYPILIGRSFLAGEYLIDTSAVELHPLACEGQAD